MTKQEEIREGVYKIIFNNFGQRPEMLKARLLEYLHSQGVVVKVDRELPQYWFDRGVNGYTERHYMAVGIKECVEEAGYVAVEPLI